MVNLKNQRQKLILAVSLTSALVLVGWLFTLKYSLPSERHDKAESLLSLLADTSRSFNGLKERWISLLESYSNKQTKSQAVLSSEQVNNLTNKLKEEILNTGKTAGSADVANELTYRNEELGFEFKYPQTWQFDEKEKLLSPQKISFYEIGSNSAPVSFGLYTQGSNFGQMEYCLKNCQRNSPDSTIIINGREFTLYDLKDYGRYEGASAGNVVYVVGPEISLKDTGRLVFEWQERPGNSIVPGNDKNIFLEIIKTINLLKN